MTSINPIRIGQLNNEFVKTPATAPKAKPDAGKSTLQSVEDPRTIYEYIMPEFLGGKPKPEPKKPDPKPEWYMIPFHALYNLGLLILDGLKSAGNGLKVAFHYVTCGCFQGNKPKVN